MSNETENDDYRLYFDANSLGAHHLMGQPVVVVIEKVERGKAGHGNKAERKPILHFKGKKLPFITNKTNARTIAALYGKRTSQWVGKAIELYPTTTKFGPDTVDCIRVSARMPEAA